MKKVMSMKIISIVLMCLLLMNVASEIFATSIVFGDEGTTQKKVSKTEFDEAQGDGAQDLTPQTTTDTTKGTGTEKEVKRYDKDDGLPQTGIEDYNIGILLIIAIASAIFAYRKINDYKNI